VLGGGTVSVEVQSDGTSSIVDELDTAMGDADGTCGNTLREAGMHCM